MNRLKRLIKAFNTYLAIADGKPVIANLHPSNIRVGRNVSGVTFYGFEVSPGNKYRLEVRAVRNYKIKESDGE